MGANRQTDRTRSLKQALTESLRDNREAMRGPLAKAIEDVRNGKRDLEGTKSVPSCPPPHSFNPLIAIPRMICLLKIRKMIRIGVVQMTLAARVNPYSLA